MKIAEFIIENNIVEFYNSSIGVESVLINNKRVSESFSLLGKDHVFIIGTDEYLVRPDQSLFSFGERIQLYKNGVLQSFENRISFTEKGKLFFYVVSVMVLGVSTGLGISWFLAY